MKLFALLVAPFLFSGCGVTKSFSVYYSNGEHTIGSQFQLTEKVKPSK